MSKQATLSSFLGLAKPSPADNPSLSPSKAASTSKAKATASNASSKSEGTSASNKSTSNVKKRKRVIEEDDEDFDPNIHAMEERDDDHIVEDAYEDDNDQDLVEGIDLSEEEEPVKAKKGRKKAKTVEEDQKSKKLAHLEHTYAKEAPSKAKKAASRSLVENDDDEDEEAARSKFLKAKKASAAAQAKERKETRRMHGMTIEAKLESAQETVDEEKHALFSEVIVASVERARDRMLKHMSEEITGEEDGDQEEEEEVEEKPAKSAKKSSAKSSTKGPKYTPLELQYLEIRKQYPDSVLFVESGYRYKFFGKDAEIASKVLNIRTGISNNFLATSVPVHRLHVHALRLVQAGYKVGVVSQTETAALKAISSNKSGPFARAVSALYTKSTLVNESMDPLTSESASYGQYLMAIYESPAGASLGMKKAPSGDDESRSSSQPFHLQAHQSHHQVEAIRIDVVAVKTSTGDIIYDSFIDGFLRTELETRLRHISPIEIIMGENVSGPTKKMVQLFSVGGVNKDDNVRIETLGPECFNFTHAKGLIDDELTLFDESKLLQQHTKKQSSSKGNASSTPNSSSSSHSILASQLKAKSQSFFAGIDVSLTCAFGGLVDYLKRFGISSLICLSCNFNPFSNTQRMYLDGNALYNLELLSNQQTGTREGSLLSIIDRTSTPFGKRRLMAWIRQPLVNHIDIENRLDAVDELSKLAIPKFGESSESSQSSSSSKPSSSNDKSHQSKLGLLISLLPTLPDLERGICRIFYNRCSVSEFISVLLGFKQIERCIPKEDEIESCAHSTLLRKILREIPTDLFSHVSYFLDALNVQSTDKQKRDLFVNDTIFPALREAKSSQAEVERSLEDHLEEIRKAIGKPRLEYITKNKDEYVIEVTPAEGARAPKSWIPLASPKSASRFHTPFIIEKYKELLQCRETLSIEIANAWATFVAEFASRYPIFRSTVESLTSLDCLHSLACIAKIEGYVRPSIYIPPTESSSHDNGEPVEPTDKSSASLVEPHESSSKSATTPHSFFDLNTQLTIVNGRHPIVENLLSVAGKQFVPNDTLMGVNEHGQKCTIITGPNMGGKTCYTRQVAVLCVMAQMGSFVPAESMKFTPLDAIYTRMGAYDNLSKGQSTFFVELQETSDIMRLATSRSLVILDELGRGTSTHDGFSIAYATLHHLLTVNRCFTLFVTHYPALSQLTRIYPTLAQNHHISYLEQHPETGKSSMEIISSEGEVLKAGQEVSNNSMDVDDVVVVVVENQDSSSVLKRNASSSLSEALHQAGPRITFLHKLVKGVEGRSFGMNVARMARLPPQVISSASEKSVMLEANVKRRYSRMAFKKVCELARCGEGAPTNLKESVQAVSRMLTAVVSGTPSSSS